MRKTLGKLYHWLFYKRSPVNPLAIFRNRDKKDVTLPADDSFLSDQSVQWWYWTGHLRDETGKKYGFEIVFFAFDSWIVFRNQLAQAAITDIDRESYHYREHVKYCSLPRKLDGKFNLEVSSGDRDVIAAFGGKGRDSLYCEVDDYILDLNLESLEDPVIHYDGKAHHYSFGGYTYYYSRERMKTEGTIKIEGKTYKVEGISWFDRQYGDLYRAIFKGWQWFAIELFDKRTIMLYDFLGEYSESEKFGSITHENETKVLNHNDYEVIILDRWKCPRTDIQFPSGWRIKLEDMEFIIEPVIKHQALVAKHVFWIGPEYWEGACNVYDDKYELIGEAYVELNGFGHKLISMNLEGYGGVNFGI
ncbi:carotenoid 1,2-hydratase [Wukongibacter baidiensis]|uniref:lipocalin-like domain-containing protein n=1 Tax=Wukongibacter baidiensis TaxID=1723361 RepID=UPI003D7FA920